MNFKLFLLCFCFSCVSTLCLCQNETRVDSSLKNKSIRELRREFLSMDMNTKHYKLAVESKEISHRSITAYLLSGVLLVSGIASVVEINKPSRDGLKGAVQDISEKSSLGIAAVLSFSACGVFTLVGIDKSFKARKKIKSLRD